MFVRHETHEPYYLGAWVKIKHTDKRGKITGIRSGPGEMIVKINDEWYPLRSISRLSPLELVDVE